MKAEAVPVLAVFEKKIRLEVPLFQRQYVWSQAQQWEPLWEDISRKFSEYLEGNKDTPVHFLGAMVLDQKQTPTAHVEKRQIIDGQQRLTTLQIFLSAFRDYCAAQGFEDLAKECETFTLNKGMMANPDDDRFKVWPTLLDRPQYTDVLTAMSRAEVERRYPLKRRKYARRYDPRPRMVEAYLFFYDSMIEFFEGTSEESPIADELPILSRLDECFKALKNALKVAVIDLEHGDDAQVIFETLNARGEPLLPADLLRNYIFLRAARIGENQEDLYETYWRRFDTTFWRHEVKQGRLLRPRSDLFIQHYLASRQARDIPIKHLFVEYKHWIDRAAPFASVRAELESLAKQGDDFVRIVDPKRDDPIYNLSVFLDAFDIRTAYPLLLSILDADISDEEWEGVSEVLESYLLRRAVCGLTTKNYNKIFLNLTKRLRSSGISADALRKALLEQSGDSVEWPSDSMFEEAWHSKHVYYLLNNPKVVHILKAINTTYLNSKMETLSIDGALTVEHILPRNWKKHWPLSNGQLGMDAVELFGADDSDSRAKMTRERNEKTNVFGNLTLLTMPLNSSVSNGPWEEKRRAILQTSLLPINQVLHAFETWNENSIEVRSVDLFSRAKRIWPR